MTKMLVVMAMLAGGDIILDGQALAGDTCEETLAGVRANEARLIRDVRGSAPWELLISLTGGALLAGIIFGVYASRER